MNVREIVFTIFDDGDEYYRAEPSQQFLGTQFDIKATDIRVVRPIEENESQLFITFANHRNEVISTLPVDLMGSIIGELNWANISKHESITISFKFTRESEPYVKNSIPVTMFFSTGQQPRFNPNIRELSKLVKILWENSFSDVTINKTFNLKVKSLDDVYVNDDYTPDYPPDGEYNSDDKLDIYEPEVTTPDGMTPNLPTIPKPSSIQHMIFKGVDGTTKRKIQLDNSILFDRKQILFDSEKEIARKNIDTLSSNEIRGLVSLATEEGVLSVNNVLPEFGNVNLTAKDIYFGDETIAYKLNQIIHALNNMGINLNLYTDDTLKGNGTEENPLGVTKLPNPLVINEVSFDGEMPLELNIKIDGGNLD